MTPSKEGPRTKLHHYQWDIGLTRNPKEGTTSLLFPLPDVRNMPRILNQDLDWDTIAVNLDVKRAFRGTPAKTLIAPHRMLCRFITAESEKKKIPGTQIFFSPWWTDWNSTFRMLAHWQAAGATTEETVRAKLAVTEEFSQELDCLVQIVLTKPVFAWEGVANYQDDKDRRITYVGGATQLYLPNLAADSKGLSSSVAYVQCFTSVDSLT